MTVEWTARQAWIDASNGVSGDMLLGALVDAGAPLDVLQHAVDMVIPATVRLAVADVRRAGMRATKVDVVVLRDDLPQRSWMDIRAMLEAAELGDRVRSRSVAVFRRLAAAEARAHGSAAEEVHFHEVGSFDSIADIVGVCSALEELAIDRLTAGPVALGSGFVRTAHGELTVPVPAVLELAAGWRVRAGGPGELATPTGMALVTTLAEGCQDLPPIAVQSVGVGAGTRDLQARPNVVRVVLGLAGNPTAESEVDDRDVGHRSAVVLAANVDDLDPRVWPSVLAALMGAGASDVWLTPILMKKGRPAHTLSVLAPPHLVDVLRDLMFSLVPTLGVREWLVAKSALTRTWRTVEVVGAAVRIKLGLSDDTILTATPEYEDVVMAADGAGLPLRQALDLAVAAAHAAGLVPGREVPAAAHRAG